MKREAQQTTTTTMATMTASRRAVHGAAATTATKIKSQRGTLKKKKTHCDCGLRT